MSKSTRAIRCLGSILVSLRPFSPGVLDDRFSQFTRANAEPVASVSNCIRTFRPLHMLLE